MYEPRAKIAVRYFRATGHPLSGEDGSWVVECPSLPGCISQGKTKEEAVQNIREAIEGYVLALQQDGLPIPPERFYAVLLAV